MTLLFLVAVYRLETMGVAVFDGWSLERAMPGINIDFTEDEIDALIELWEETDGEEGWDPYWNSGCNRYIIEFWSTPGLAYTLLSDGSYRVSIGTATAESNIIMPTIHNRRDVFEIPANQFSNRSNILSVSLPRQVKVISNYAFQNCTGLTAFKLNSTEANLGFGMLSGCTNLTNVTLAFVGKTFEGTSNTNFGYIFGTTDINSQQNYVPSSLTTVIITKARSIASNAFWNCVYLKDISLIIASGKTSAFSMITLSMKTK